MTPSATEITRPTPLHVRVQRAANNFAAEAQDNNSIRARKRLFWRRIICLLVMLALLAVVIVM